MLFGVATGRRGDHYDYFFCSGRHSGRTSCDLPYLPLEQVESAVEAQWQRETFPAALAEALGHQSDVQQSGVRRARVPGVASDVKAAIA